MAPPCLRVVIAPLFGMSPRDRGCIRPARSSSDQSSPGGLALHRESEELLFTFDVSAGIRTSTRCGSNLLLVAPNRIRVVGDFGVRGPGAGAVGEGREEDVGVAVPFLRQNCATRVRRSRQSRPARVNGSA